MLKVYFGKMEDVIYDTSVYFNNTYYEEWLEEPIAKEIIKDIDKSEVLSGLCIKSPVLGQIPPTMLAGGTKTLLLVLNDTDKVFNASTCGDNCAKWLLRIAKEEDRVINLRHIMHFEGDFEVEVLNNGEIVRNMEDLARCATEFLRET